MLTWNNMALNSQFSGIAIKCYVGKEISGDVGNMNVLTEMECDKGVTQCYKLGVEVEGLFSVLSFP